MKESVAYKSLCTEYYELDKPAPPADALKCYLNYAKEAEGRILEPMCGTGRFLIPLLEQGYTVVGFDSVSRVDEGLFLYELWEANGISKTEVEDYRVRYYEPAEIESLLQRHGLETIAKWQAEPYTMIEASDADSVVLFECIKK